MEVVMKILIVSHFPLEGSGSGTYTMSLARELSKVGHEVRVIYPEHRQTTYDGFDSRVIIFNSGRNDYFDMSFNFPCFTSHSRSRETFYNLSDMQLKEYVDKFIEVVQVEADSFKPDMIHAQHIWVASYAASLTGLPYVITSHGTDLKGVLGDERYVRYAREGAAGAGSIIAVSRYVRDEVARLYPSEKDKVVMLPGGYDSSIFRVKDVDRAELAQLLGVEDLSRKIVSFAGKLTRFKGADVLLRAAKRYEERLGGAVHTVIAGGGDMDEELMKLRDDLELKNVHLVGHISQSELADLLNISDVVAVPSRSENSGLAAMEAMACGAPVVGTTGCCLADVITDDVGSLAQADDDLSLSDAIVRELMRGDRESRGRECASYASGKFSWDRSIREIERIYGDAVKNDEKQGCDS
jgi:glycosyltransferase involved in cell wall biosynthesis